MPEKVDDGAQGPTIVVYLTGQGIQMDVELGLEEVQLEDHNNKVDPIQVIRMRPRTRSGKRDLRGECQIETIGNSEGKDSSQIPNIWL